MTSRIFAAMFRVLPQCPVAWREVLAGALSSFAVFFGAELTRVIAERQRSARSATLRHAPCLRPAG